MSTFTYLDSELHCDGVSLATIARAEGTPLYVYSAAAIGVLVARRSERLRRDAVQLARTHELGDLWPATLGAIAVLDPPGGRE